MKGKFGFLAKYKSAWQFTYVSPEDFEKALDQLYGGRKLLVTRVASGHVTHEIMTVTQFTKSWVWTGISHMLSDDSKLTLYPDLDNLLIYDLEDKGHLYITAISRRPSVVTESESNTNG